MQYTIPIWRMQLYQSSLTVHHLMYSAHACKTEMLHWWTKWCDFSRQRHLWTMFHILSILESWIPNLLRRYLVYFCRRVLIVSFISKYKLCHWFYIELLMFRHARCDGNIYKGDKDVQRPGKYSKSTVAIVYITRFVIFNGGNSFFFLHDDVNKWKHFPRYWPFVRGIHRSPVNSPHKGQWRGAFDVFFDPRLNKRLSKQSWGWWFETLSCPVWRHCNDKPRSVYSELPQKSLQ